MPSVLVRLAMFASAYAPLLFLFALLNSFGRGWPSDLCAVIAGASLLLLGWLWFEIGRQNPITISTAETQPRDSDVISFFITYVVPFAAAQDVSRRGRLALMLFLVIIAGLYLRAGLLYVNPLLALIGFRVFKIKDQNGRFILLLTKRRFLRQNEEIKAVQIDDYLHVEQR
jgi:hypothetical protein